MSCRFLVVTLIGAGDCVRNVGPSSSIAAATLPPLAVAPFNTPSATDESYAEGAYLEPNPQPQNYTAICPNMDHAGCWPMMYIIGVQKAATTSVADLLAQHGLVAFGMPRKDNNLTNNNGACHDYHLGCKENFHNLANLRSDDGRRRFKSLFHPDHCDEYNGDFADSMKVACRQRRFLDGTPMWLRDITDGEAGQAIGEETSELHSLFQAIPPTVLGAARYLLILREPVSRLLSWYNHLKVGYHFMKADTDKSMNASTFDAFLRWNNNIGGYAFKIGRYPAYLDFFYSNQHTARSQLMVINFESLVTSPGPTVATITAHFGLPILRNVRSLPSANDIQGPGKVVAIKCSTREYGRELYQESNARLYSQLDYDRSHGRAPPSEPAFRRFDVKESLYCNDDGERLHDGKIQPV